MVAPRLVHATTFSLYVLLAFLVSPATPSPLPQLGTRFQPNREAALRTCLEKLKSTTSRESSAGDQTSSDAGSAPSWRAADVACKSLLDDVISGLYASDLSEANGSEEQSSLIASPETKSHGEVSQLPGSSNEQEGNSGVSSAAENDASDEDSAASSQVLKRRIRDLGPEGRGLMLRAHGAVSQLLREMGVGESDVNTRNTADRRNPNTLFHTLAKMSALGKLKNALVQQSLPSAGNVMLEPSLELAASLQQGRADDGGRRVEEDAASSSSSPSSSRGSAASALLNSADDKDDASWNPDSDAERHIPSRFSLRKRGASGYSTWYSRAQSVAKRRSNTLSINNAMMAITDMLLAEQKERLQRNRESIRYHMLVQG